MKKVIYLSALFVLLTLFNFSSAFGQAARQGNFIIDPYYGGPNFGKAFVEAVEDENPGNINFKSRAIGPAGLRVEYMLGDQIGLGFDAIFNSRNIKFDARDTIINTSGDQEIQENSYEYDMKRLRVQLRFNYHFNISNPDLDSYLGIGAGTNNRFRTTFENGNEIEDDLSDLTLIQFSARVCAGMRYYFTENLGLNAEIGLGGPLVSAGVSFKF